MKFLNDWIRDTPISGWDSFCERSSFLSWFSPFEFRDITRTMPEWTRPCGCRKSSSGVGRAAILWLFILRYSWDSFFVTLTSNSVDNLVKYFSWTLGTFEFRAWLFFRCLSWLFFLMAASFFLTVAVVRAGEIFNNNENCWIFSIKSKNSRVKFSRNTLNV